MRLACQWTVRARTLLVAPASAGWLICDQVPNEARGVGAKRRRRILRADGLRRDVVPPAALTASHTPDRPPFYLFPPEMASSIGAVSYQQFPIPLPNSGTHAATCRR
jgi:hypothetical protein